MKARKILVAAALAVAGFATPALAQTDGTYVGGETVVRGEELVRTPQVDAAGARAGAAADVDDRGGLPVTGGDVAGLVAMGVAAIGTGTVMVRRSRRPVSP